MQPNPTPASFPGTTGDLPPALHRPAPAAGLQLGAALRAGPPRRARGAQRHDDRRRTRTPTCPSRCRPARSAPARPTSSSSTSTTARAPSPREGWWNWGGITRPVELVARGRLTCDDLGAAAAARLRRDRPLQGRPGARRRLADQPPAEPHRARPSASACLAARARGDRQRGQRRAAARAGRRPPASRSRCTSTARPSSGRPTRPRATTARRRDAHGDGARRPGRHAEDRPAPVSVRDGNLLLNGRRLELRGASVQEDVPGRGPALTDARHRRRSSAS